MKAYPKLSTYALILALIGVLGIPCLFPAARLTFFAPYLVILFYRKPFIRCLWISLFCGLLLDLVSSQLHFGLYALSYVATTALLYRQKQFFFEDSLTTLPVMTFFFSVTSTFINGFLVTLLHKEASLSFGWVITDLIFLSIIDSIYAVMLLLIPIYWSRRPVVEQD